MEEIRTSEKLEQEILEDARRKAERILKGAEKSIGEIEAEWKKKEDAFLADMEKELEERKKRIQQEISSSIPLEMKRMELRILNEKFETFLQKFFEELTDEEFTSLIRSRLAQVGSFFQGKPLFLMYNGLSQVESLVRSILPGISIVSIKKGGPPRGVRIQSEDGTVQYRITVTELMEEVIQRYRREVFEALFPAMKG
ncbi:MAG: V-type ATP synthase subunit E [Spirochaetes bacterium]|nr:V-type ATP synthase subunit E [Spirochaetota bacterium]